MISSPSRSKDKHIMEKTSFLRRLATLAPVLLVLVSCAPQAFVIRPEMRTASKSGLNLMGKSMGVVYLTGKETAVNEFNEAIADGFASRLEEDYFGGQQEIGLFKMPAIDGADYSVKDSLIKLVLESGKDVVFLFDIPTIGEPVLGKTLKVAGRRVSPDSSYVTNVTSHFLTKVYVYDSMNKQDQVLAFNGDKSLSTDVYSLGAPTRKEVMTSLPAIGYKAGVLAANTFLSGWKQDYFQVIYYDGAESAWNKGAEKAYTFHWDEAIKEWMTLVNNKSAEKRSCAAYNIALGCFMSGLPDLALEWLDRSDKDMPISISKDLRKKIKEYTGR